MPFDVYVDCEDVIVVVDVTVDDFDGKDVVVGVVFMLVNMCYLLFLLLTVKIFGFFLLKDILFNKIKTLKFGTVCHST